MEPVVRDRIVRYLTSFSSAGLMAEVVGASPTVAELEGLRQSLEAGFSLVVGV
jgi:hypothetical protein